MKQTFKNYLSLPTKLFIVALMSGVLLIAGLHPYSAAAATSAEIRAQVNDLQAQINANKKKAAELWNPAYKAWFPKGLEDPELLLLKVDIEQAEYWDNPGGIVTTLIGYAQSLATGKQAKIGEHATVEL